MSEENGKRRSRSSGKTPDRIKQDIQDIDENAFFQHINDMIQDHICNAFDNIESALKKEEGMEDHQDATAKVCDELCASWLESTKVPLTQFQKTVSETIFNDLPESSSQIKNFKTEEDKLDTEIAELQTRYRQVKYVNDRLKDEAVSLDANLAAYHAMVPSADKDPFLFSEQDAKDLTSLVKQSVVLAQKTEQLQQKASELGIDTMLGTPVSDTSRFSSKSKQ